MPATRRNKRNRSESANEQSQPKKKKAEVKTEVDELENEFDSEAENKVQTSKSPIKTEKLEKNVPSSSRFSNSEPESEDSGTDSETEASKQNAKKQSKKEKENEDGLSSYEIKRLKNVQDNKDFFSKLGIEELKSKMYENQRVKLKNKPSQRGLKDYKEKNNEPTVRRLSLRLQQKDPEGVPLPPDALNSGRATFQYERVDEHPRKPSGPMNMEDQLYKEDMDDHNELMDYLGPKLLKKVKLESPGDQSSKDSFVKDFTKITLTPERVAKVVPERIFSVAVHPSPHVTLAVAGDKWGRIGLWNVLAGRQYVSDGVVVYTPHSRPVNCIKFCKTSTNKMYSCSYDGTLRCCDLERGIFDEVYATPEDDDNLLKNFDFISSDSLIVAQQDGTVAMVDKRIKKDSAESIYPIHNKAFRSVSVHPVQKHIFTSAGDGSVNIWDIRKLKKSNNKCLDCMNCGANVNSAYFSPLTGKYILSASINDRINIYDASDVGNLKVACSFKHDNHVGRWLTGFRPTWHPQREDLFVSGSMSRPRQIELYGVDGKLIKTFRGDDLGSVCSLNEIHPTKNILVGGNSSGRLHVFM